MFGWVRKQVAGVEIGQHGTHRSSRRRSLSLESLEGRISLSGVGVDLGQGAVQVDIGIALSTPTATRQNPQG